MAYSMIPGYNQALYISDGKKKYYAGYDQLGVMNLVTSLNKCRPKVEQREDGLYICWGGHASCQECRWVQEVAYHKYSGRKLDEELEWGSILSGTTPVSPEVNVSTTAIPPHVMDQIKEQRKGYLGWICPKCKTGVSPFKSICPCNDENKRVCNYPLDSQSSF